MQRNFFIELNLLKQKQDNKRVYLHNCCNYFKRKNMVLSNLN